MKDVYNGAFELEGEQRVDLNETSDHRQLHHKDAEDQHPIKAIEGLQEKLDGLQGSITALQQAEAEVIALGRDVDAKISELLAYKEAAIAGIELAEEIALQEIVDEINETIANITATATKIDTGSTPTVTVTHDGDDINFEFGLPQGEQGDPGQDGEDGQDGADGADGYTPVRGVDYWTAADQAAIVADVLQEAGDADADSY